MATVIGKGKNVPVAEEQAEGSEALPESLETIGEATEKERPPLLKMQELTEEDVWELLENTLHGVYPNGSYIPLRKNTPAILINEIARHSKGKVTIEDLPIVARVEKIRRPLRRYGEGQEQAAWDQHRKYGGNHSAL